MMSMFSSFDFYYWSIPMFVFLLISLNMIQSIPTVSVFLVFSGSISSSILSYFSTMKLFKPKFMDLFLISIIMTIFLSNFFSIFPFFFSYTSQVSTLLWLSLSSVLSFNMILVSKNFKGFLIHLVPGGSPSYLSIFLFLIEIISASIRPMTLFIRLMSNILSGHLLLILLSKMVSLYAVFFLAYTFLNMVEMFVAMIQSYIFCVLTGLYLSELE